MRKFSEFFGFVLKRDICWSRAICFLQPVDSLLLRFCSPNTVHTRACCRCAESENTVRQQATYRHCLTDVCIDTLRFITLAHRVRTSVVIKLPVYATKQPECVRNSKLMQRVMWAVCQRTNPDLHTKISAVLPSGYKLLKSTHKWRAVSHSTYKKLPNGFKFEQF